MKKRLLTVLLVTVWAMMAQAPADRVLGEVKKADTAAKVIEIKPDTGDQVKVQVAANARVLRIAPGEKDLKNAAPVELATIGAGDRVLARGKLSEDKTTLEANLVVLMTKAEISKKNAAERAEWEKRGMLGTVTALSADKKELTITQRALGTQKIVIVDASAASFKRYAPGSVKFEDAVDSEFPQIVVGDQVRVLGDKNEDGSHWKAESVVSGTFKNLAATIKTIDVATGTIVGTDLDTKKPVTIKVSSDANLKKLPPFMAQMIAMRLTGATMRPGMAAAMGGAAAAGGAAPGGAAGARPGGGAGFGGPGGGPGGPGGAGRGDMQQMMERVPSFKLDELKPGDALIVASTKGADPAAVNAITVLAGVEAILSASPAAAQNLNFGSWNLDSSMGMGMAQ